MTRTRSSLAQSRRVVVKIGSRLLADAPEERIEVLASEAAALRARGVEVVIVTSGAIALGVRRLGLDERPRHIAGLQAAAAVGQGALIHLYDAALARQALTCAQVLVTHDDVQDRRRYLNARHALGELLQLGAVPVINENDTVSVDEIKFGDNDRLAALVASLIDADTLIILTDVDGLHDGDPKAGARLIAEVTDIERQARPVAGGSGSSVGTGGMSSKVDAAAIAGRFGVVTLVASGRRARPVTSLLDGIPDGTVFWPAVEPLAARKHWIAYALTPAGTVVVDAGARRALTDGKKSLLPSGVRAVHGHFGAGEPVSVVEEGGVEFARGLAALDADELRKVAGRRSGELEAVLGYRGASEVVHRDDLVLL